MRKSIETIREFTEKPLIRHTEQKFNVKDFGKVAVILGGHFSEREISLQSGQAILDSLLKQGIEAVAIDSDRNLPTTLFSGKFDRAFIALHGKEGEDGSVQGLLEILQLPYTGSKVAASALAMDKIRSKMVMKSLKIATPPFGVAQTYEQAHQLCIKLGCPLSVKPSNEGSSIGVSKVTDMAQLPKAFELAKQYGPVIVEKWIEGKDFFVSIVNGRVLPSVEVQPKVEFYDYNAKYKSNATQYHCPAPHSDAKEGSLRILANKAFTALGCEGWGRVDLVQDLQGKFWVLEVNTIPGMTSHSLVPMSAKAAGINFDELVIEILSTTLPHYKSVDLIEKII